MKSQPAEASTPRLHETRRVNPPNGNIIAPAKAKRQPPIYPWLIALYPVLFLYSQNLGNVFEGQVWESIGVTVLATTVVVGLIWGVTRSLARAAVITAILVLAFFTYGHIYNLMFVGRPPMFPILAVVYVMMTAAAILIVLGALSDAILWRAAPALNAIAAILVIMTLPPIVMHAYRGFAQSRSSGEIAADAPRIRNRADRPDIYYIILDAYSANKHFERDFGYDNSAFTDALEDRGFFVAYDSMTNYGVTLPSMLASLNMRYIGPEDRVAAQGSKSDADYMREMVADSEVARQMRGRGYSYIFMLSGFDLPSKTADLNIDFYPSGPKYFFADDPTKAGNQEDIEKLYQRPFIPLLLETTALRSLADEAQKAEQAQATIEGDPWLFWKPERAVMTWDEAERIPDIPEATFTVVHIIKPHEPIAFRRDGTIRPYPFITYDQPYEEVRSAFFEQVEYTNTRTLQMIDAILAKSTVPPIIILQGDHGSNLGRPESLDHRRTNFEILNAYYLPQQPDCITDPAMVPVNSFRAVLNCTFGTDYAMLDARHFAMPDNYEDLFNIEEVDIQEWQSSQVGGR